VRFREVLLSTIVVRANYWTIGFLRENGITHTSAEDYRQAEQAIYDRILAEHLERKQAALAERRQRLPEWQELDTLAGDIPGRDGRHAAGWDA
jgi:hypothetical protein